MSKTIDSKHKSKNVLEVSDPRAEKTRAQISGAFAYFISRRPYAKIRVSDITKKAQVGRATFYAHFATKDSLLRVELRRIVHPMIAPRPGDPCLADCTALFAHLQHAQAIYRSLMAGESRAITERIVQDALEERIAQILRASKANAGDDLASPTFVPRFVASTLLALIAWSLEQAEAPSPAKLQELYRSLVGRALEVDV
jgi:AcrR family transcriptional regulator